MFAGPLGRSTFTPPKSSFDSPLYGLVSLRRSHLLLAWVSTEAVRTQSRELVLGRSLTKFMKTLGVYSSGGGNVHTKLRNQMKRLFGCTVSMIYKDEHGEQFVSSLIAERGEFWWNERKPRSVLAVGQQDISG